MSSETYDAVGRLCKVKFEHGMSSLGRMSAIGRAILPGEEGHMWTTDSCEKLRDKLIDLLQSSWNDGFDDGYASADDWLADHEDAMREHGWVRKEEIDAVRHECEERIARVVDESMTLPRDYDGVPIRVGDVMEFIDGEPFDVIGIGEHTLYYYDEEDEAVHWTRSSSKRHYHREDER